MRFWDKLSQFPIGYEAKVQIKIKFPSQISKRDIVQFTDVSGFYGS